MEENASVVFQRSQEQCSPSPPNKLKPANPGAFTVCVDCTLVDRAVVWITRPVDSLFASSHFALCLKSVVRATRTADSPLIYTEKMTTPNAEILEKVPGQVIDMIR